MAEPRVGPVDVYRAREDDRASERLLGPPELVSTVPAHLASLRSLASGDEALSLKGNVDIVLIRAENLDGDCEDSPVLYLENDLFSSSEESYGHAIQQETGHRVDECSEKPSILSF